MEIIDFERKGNLVRFYLGKNGEQWGDDWNDYPYDCNAGTVYDNFVESTRDIAFDFDDLVLEPCCGVLNCYYSKEDMIKRTVPCIIVVPKEVIEKDWHWEDFRYWVASDKVKKYYFGDKMEDNE